MQSSKFKFILFICINIGIIFIFSNSVFPTSMQVKINETNLITKINDNQYKINSNGTLNLFNPTNFSHIYEFEATFRNDIFLNYIVNDSNLIKDLKSFKGRDIFANSSKIITYSFNGILTYDLYENFSLSNKSLFEWYLKSIDFVPNRYITLNKKERINENSTNTSSRLVLIEGENFCEFNISIDSLKLFKTHSQNGSSVFNEELLNKYENIDLKMDDEFKFSIVDYNSDDKTVYWIDSLVVTKNKIISNYLNNFIDLGTQVSSGGGSSSGNSRDKNKDNNTQIKELSLNFLKTVDREKLEFGDDIIVTLRIQNPNNYDIYNLEIEDLVNEYFQINKLNNSNSFFKNNKLYNNVSKIGAYENFEIKYGLKFEKHTNESLLYFDSAKLSYDNNIIYSNYLILINNVLNYSKKIVLEKEIVYLDENRARVFLRVKNIGNLDVFNLVLVEDNSQLFILENKTNLDYVKKWNINVLKSGKNWEVYYDENINSLNKNIPQIYGVEDIRVYKTIILNDKFGTNFDYPKIKTYQKLMIGVAVILLFIDVLF